MEELLSKLLQKGVLLKQLRKYDMADKVFMEAYGIDPDNYWVIYHLCETRLFLNRLEDALDLNDQLMQRFDIDTDTLRLRYSILIESGRSAEAEETIAEALRMEPDEVNHWRSLAHIYLYRNQFLKAIDFAEKGLEKNPADTECLNYIALALSSYGQLFEARKFIKESLRLNPNDSNTFAFAGWVDISSHKQLNDYQLARRYFQQALALDPSNEWAREGLKQTVAPGNPVPNIITFGFVALFMVFLFVQQVILRIATPEWLLADLAILVFGVAGCIAAHRIFK